MLLIPENKKELLKDIALEHITKRREGIKNIKVNLVCLCPNNTYAAYYEYYSLKIRCIRNSIHYFRFDFDKDVHKTNVNNCKSIW